MSKYDPMYLRYARTCEACRMLKLVIRVLREAGAPKATNKARRALKSAEGARRNALRFWNQDKRARALIAWQNREDGA